MNSISESFSVQDRMKSFGDAKVSLTVMLAKVMKEM